MNRKYVQPVIKILAKLAGLGHFQKVPVGCRDEPDVDLNRLIGADRVDLALLKGAEQFNLYVEAQLTDFNQEQRSTRGFLELTCMFVVGAGESALLVSEQNALNQVFRQRTTVDGNERLACAIGGALDCPCDQFFADARFALDENNPGL